VPLNGDAWGCGVYKKGNEVITDPERMTQEQRDQEVAHLLARSLWRIHELAKRSRVTGKSDPDNEARPVTEK